MCAVPNMVVFCSSLTSRFPGILVTYYYYYYYYHLHHHADNLERMGDRRSEYRVFVGRLEGRRPLARPERRWEGNIIMNHHKVGCGGMSWIHLARYWDRWRTLVSAVMNLRVP